MSTRHVLLALLSIKPMTGYELAQNIKASVDSLWTATHSQIYPALHKLQEEQLVTSESHVRGQLMQRIVYTITDVGNQEFERWLNQPIQYLPFRDPFMLWASYMEACPPDVVFRNIDEHIQLCRLRAESLERIAESILKDAHPLMQARQGRNSPEQIERVRRSRSVVYMELAARMRFEIASAQRLRQVAAELCNTEITEPE